MELMEAIKTRRSCRSFTDQAVGDEQIQAMLEALSWAPSPLNLQPWRVVLVSDPAMKKQMREVARDARRSVAEGGGPSWAAKYPLALLEEAPLLICVACDPVKGGLGTYFNQPFGAFAAACAGVQNLMLAAQELGLGTVWFTFFDPKAMGRLIGLDDNLDLVGVLPVGVPKAEVQTPPRKTVEPLKLA